MYIMHNSYTNKKYVPKIFCEPIKFWSFKEFINIYIENCNAFALDKIQNIYTQNKDKSIKCYWCRKEVKLDNALINYGCREEENYIEYIYFYFFCSERCITDFNLVKGK